MNHQRICIKCILIIALAPSAGATLRAAADETQKPATSQTRHFNNSSAFGNDTEHLRSMPLDSEGEEDAMILPKDPAYRRRFGKPASGGQEAGKIPAHQGSAAPAEQAIKSPLEPRPAPWSDPQLIHPFKFAPSIYDHLDARPLPHVNQSLEAWQLQPGQRHFLLSGHGAGVSSTQYNFLQFADSLRRH